MTLKDQLNKFIKAIQEAADDGEIAPLPWTSRCYVRHDSALKIVELTFREPTAAELRVWKRSAEIFDLKRENLY